MALDASGWFTPQHDLHESGSTLMLQGPLQEIGPNSPARFCNVEYVDSKIH